MQPTLTDEQFKEYTRLSISFNAWYEQLKATIRNYAENINKINNYRIRSFIPQIDILAAYDAFRSGCYPIGINLEEMHFIKYLFPSTNKLADEIPILYTFKELQFELNKIR